MAKQYVTDNYYSKGIFIAHADHILQHDIKIVHLYTSDQIKSSQSIIENTYD